MTRTPNIKDRLLRRHADQVASDLCEQDQAWANNGWTRRRFISGAGMVGAAAIATQLVTTRAAYAATPTDANGDELNTVICVFMRGAADGLRILVPNSPDLGIDYLKKVRPNLIPTSGNLIALPSQNGWALNSALQPLYDGLWSSGELAFVPGVSSPGISRSHFQAQQYLEKGGSDTATSGWLDRALGNMGAGTTFRAVATGSAAPLSMLGPVTTLSMGNLAGFTFPGWDGIAPQSEEALLSLYRGVGGPLGVDVPGTMAALKTAAVAAKGAGVQNGAAYPNGAFSDSLKDIASMLRSEVGLQVATIDVGGWDTHTSEAGDLDAALYSVSKSLAAVMTDLGPERRKRVTVVLMTEFGRRVEMNASGGTDHGHGSLMWLMGGGLSSSSVFGKWNELSATTLESGDVPGLNNPFDVLGELLTKRAKTSSLSGVFPGHTYAPLGVASAT